MAEHTPSDLPWRTAEKIAVQDDGCWRWLASCNSSGYGKATRHRRTWLAHRLTYTLLVGDIPEGLVIDHLCRNRSCVNPSHLRPVTQRENILAPGSQAPPAINAARTTCRLGHELARRKPGTKRLCLVCDIANKRAARANPRQDDGLGLIA